MHLALTTYFVGTVNTLEKRFQIPSFYIGTKIDFWQSILKLHFCSPCAGLIGSVCDVGVIFTTLTASYLGKSSHKTRWVAFGTALVGLSCFVHLIPHWLYGPGENAMLLTKDLSTHQFLNNGSKETAGLKQYIISFCYNFTDCSRCKNISLRRRAQ
jgi:hypothetical protein